MRGLFFALVNITISYSKNALQDEKNVNKYINVIGHRPLCYSNLLTLPHVNFRKKEFHILTIYYFILLLLLV